MGSGALKPCAGGCHRLVRRGRCPSCARVPEQQRGTATERGYGAEWRRFRLDFIDTLVARDIPPICGASLKWPVRLSASRCLSEGVESTHSGDWSSLHVHHDPPLEEWERGDVKRVCDEQRCGLLCRECHSAETGKGAAA